jgi:predicted GNAT family N-acyltransferase
MKKKRIPQENTSRAYRIQFLYRPGRRLGDDAMQSLVRELREVAGTCFETIPPYQALQGSREELSDKVITVARQWDGSMVGFCSTVLLPVPGVGEVLHLGLTCVRPEARGAGLTHLLMKKAVVGYLLRHKPVGRVWVTNCAAVLSSLGNVALYFDRVVPSPFAKTQPSEKHVRIARAIGERYRNKLYIRQEAFLDETCFVFRGSVRDTVFQKSESDTRYHHRNRFLNEYYRRLMNFREGDEVLQVGHVSVLTALRYGRRKKKREKRPAAGLSVLSPGFVSDRAENWAA